jgi:hypothetical protein
MKRCIDCDPDLWDTNGFGEVLPEGQHPQGYETAYAKRLPNMDSINRPAPARRLAHAVSLHQFRVINDRPATRFFAGKQSMLGLWKLALLN